MKSVSLTLALTALACSLGCHPEHKGGTSSAPLSRDFTGIVEAGCASCVFHEPGIKGCPLAVRIDENVYLVDGTGIDDHGDAHAPDGLCNASRRARVAGSVRAGRFVAREFELLPLDPGAAPQP